jgi:predicted AlkP superfamily pyrophosphatase or phosphodiesterase
MPRNNRRTIAASLLALPLLLGAVFFRPQQPPPSKLKKEQKPLRISSHVVLVSISGLRADAVQNPGPLRMPAIQSLREKGASAIGVESVFPSQSLPAHASLLTGTLPADHGVTADVPFNEQTGTPAEEPYRFAREIKRDTLWTHAAREKLTTAAAGFPLSAGAAISFNVHAASAEESPAEAQLRGELIAALKLQALPADQSADVFNAEAAAYLIRKHRPDLTAVHFTSLDLAQQRFGLQSKEAALALERVDSLVGKIVDAVKDAGIAAGASFVILSDHGAAKVEHEFRPNVILARNKWLSVNGSGQITSWRAVAQACGGSAAIFAQSPQDERAMRELEAIFNEQHQKPDSPIWRVLPRRDAARLGADPRPVLFLDAAPTYQMSGGASGSSTSKTNIRAGHGYSPSRAEMRSMLLLSGRGVKPGVMLEYARLIDIAPTIARLLGLEMKTARGRVLAEAIAP